jgi:predicted Zn finger-like uncharacterized protein
MIVTCAGCGTKYRVAEDKVGVHGVKVKCPKCRTVFEVRPKVEEQSQSLAERLLGEDVRVEQPAERVPAPAEPSITRESKEEPLTFGAPEEPGAGEGPEPTPEPTPEPLTFPTPGPMEPHEDQELEGGPDEDEESYRAAEEEPEAPGVAPPESPPSPFAADEEDPKTLARALVSDILFYNRESRDRGLAEGKVLAYLGKEIARSWETYKERVGIERALEADYFKEAVNEILGEGQKIF